MTRAGLLRAAVAILCLVAHPAAAAAQELDCEAGEKEVREVRFEGNTQFSDDQLARQVATTASDLGRRVPLLGPLFGSRRCLKPAELALDRQRLERFYANQGFIGTTADTIVRAVRGDAVSVTFTVQEAAPILVDSFSVLGLDSVPEAREVLRGLVMAPGARFSEVRLAADMDTIRSRLLNVGYPLADVLRERVFASPRERRATVLLNVMPGPRARLGEVRILVDTVRGNGQQISDRSVRAVIGVDPGDLFRDRELAGAQRNLHQLGAYRGVALTIDTTSTRSDSLVHVTFALREDRMRQIDAEVGWATLDCFRLRGQFADKAFLRTARRLEVSGQLSKIGWARPTDWPATRGLCYEFLEDDLIASNELNYSVATTLRPAGAFGGRAIPSYSLYSERRGAYKAYLRTTLVGGAVTLSRSVGYRMPVQFAYNLEYGHTDAQPAVLCFVFRACDEPSRQQVTGRDRRLAILSGTWARDRTDNPVNARAGTILRAELRAAATAIGSDPSLTFVKGQVDAGWYRGLTPSLVLATRLRAGLIGGGRSTEGARLPPPQERLYAGGESTVRGFQENELGALIYLVDKIDTVETIDGQIYYRADTTRDAIRTIPVGGNALVVGNLELRIRDPFFPQLLQHVLFVDAGEVWTRTSRDIGLEFNELKVTPGYAVRVFTPIGPMGLNLGYNAYPLPRGPAFYDAGASESGFAPLLCVSPGAPPVSGQGVASCPATFRPRDRGGLFGLPINVTFTLVTTF